MPCLPWAAGETDVPPPSEAEAALFLFGGHGTGHDCANSMLDAVRLGDPAAGRDVEQPCGVNDGDSGELWRLQLQAPPTLAWSLVTPAAPGGAPPPREQHAAARLGRGRLVLFGGRQQSQGYVYGRTDGLGVGDAEVEPPGTSPLDGPRTMIDRYARVWSARSGRTRIHRLDRHAAALSRRPTQ